jgi:hypothetical protein
MASGMEANGLLAWESTETQAGRGLRASQNHFPFWRTASTRRRSKK